MPRAPRGPSSPRRPRTGAGTPRTVRSRPTEQVARPEEVRAATALVTPGPKEFAIPQDRVTTEPPVPSEAPAGPIAEEPRKEARFQIFIIDTGWHSPARKVLHENFAMLSALQQGDPIYVLNTEKSLVFALRHPDLMGKGPVIAVHDLNVLRNRGTGGFHGFRLHLGLMRSEQQALLALQTFVRFLATHRQSVDLEAQIRRDLRREGIVGAIEIILHHEPRELGA